MSQPERQCDIVMRGGIASGIVYPTAIAELAREYRFRSIGGTSAGAIAAAAAAAAEHGRREGSNPDAFAELAQVPVELAKRAHGRSKLYRLFQPQRRTAWLHRLTITILESSSKPLFAMFIVCVRAVLAANPLVSLAGALPAVLAAHLILRTAPAVRGFRLSSPLDELAIVGITLTMALCIMALLLVVKRLLALLVIGLGLTIGVLAYYVPDWWRGLDAFQDVWENAGPVGLAAFLLLIALASAVLVASYRTLQRVRTVVPENLFGVCAGVPAPDTGGGRGNGEQHLTEWLHETFQTLAGKPLDAPLTIGELRQVGKPDHERDDTSIELALMTTDVTRGMSHCFPQLEGADDWRGKLYFDADLLARLLPASVVAHLKQRSQKDEGVSRFVDAEGKPDPKVYHRLPKPDDLPILLGVRMSMSFPLLLSAVPLYTPTQYTGDNPAATGLQRMRRCWFSDGGLTSNFPIHFFDSPIPRRPTFGVSLADSSTEVLSGNRGSATDRQSVWMVSGRSKDRFQRFTELDSGPFRLTRFFSALFSTSRNWSDTEQMNMPGYRERIVHVVLKEDEGGLNLDMPEAIIKSMAEKGTKAGEKLVEQFTGGAWDDHRWIRYRAFMASLEIVARKFDDRWSNPAAASTARVLNGRSFPTLVREGESRDEPFPWEQGQFGPSFSATESFVDFARRMKSSGANLFDRDGDSKGLSPRPKPRLRVVPPDDTELPKPR